MILFLEGIFMCFILLLMCVIGISNGPERYVVFYEKEIQKRVYELNYTTEAETKRKYRISAGIIFVQVFLLVPFMVCVVNGTRGFADIFRESLIILYIMGVFDKGFIDGYWVQKTKAWVIEGTEDLMPYIPKKLYLKKWIGSIVANFLADHCLCDVGGFVREGYSRREDLDRGYQ